MKKNKLLLILFALLAFGQMAWAQLPTESVSYIDTDGSTNTVNAVSISRYVAGSTIGVANNTTWYYVTGSIDWGNNQLTCTGDLHLILCDGASFSINNQNGDGISGDGTLTIYGQTNQTGQIIATSSTKGMNHTGSITIYGGVINATGDTHGIYAGSNIVINRGNVTAVAPNGNAMEGNRVTINGGIVSATGEGGIKNGIASTTTLGYTNSSDRITATSYLLGNSASTVKVKDGQYMITNNGVIIYGSLDENKRNAIAGRTLSPYSPQEWDGEGEIDDPYIIDSEDDLILLSLRTGGGSEDYTGKYFRLDADLNFTASTNWDNITSPESNFSAISIFDGHFNGNSHSISGLRLHTSNNFVEQKGLFNNLGPNAYIENLTISNARIAGEKQVGAIVGYAQEGATITNCHVTGTVAVHAYGHTLQNHGGIVGYNAGTVSNCVSEATISRSNYYTLGSENVGGIAGTNTGTLSGNKVFNANITAADHYGAIVGTNNEGTLTNNYYRACTINGTANATGVGCNGADVTTNDGALSLHTITKPNDVTNSTNPTLVYGGTNYWKHGTTITLSGGLGGTPTEGWQKAYCVNDVALLENSTTIKDNFDMPAEDVTITIGEIHADWANTPNNPTAGSSSDNPYKIYFTDQMNLLATRVNNGTSTYSGKYFQLMDDLTYDNTEQNNYTAIGTNSNPFSGHFNGNQKTIDGIRINSTDGYQGVFGYIVDAEVMDLDVNDIMITGHDHVGCIVGECNGSTISNCRVTTATLTATGNYSDCPYFGGIAGYYMGTSTMSNNFVLGVNIPYVYQLGAIAGFVSSNQGLVSNYYHNCTVGSTPYPTEIGCGTGDVITNDGARPVFTVSVPDGVTATATATYTYNEVNYYKQGVTVTLSGGLVGTPGEGLQYAYIVYGNTLTGSNLAPGHEFDMQNANAVVTIGSMPADWAAEEGAGNTEENPYKIYFTEQLDLLAARVNNGTSTYSNKYFKLMDDLTYSYTGAANENNYTAIGNGSNPFSGHFDGNQKTIEGIRIYSTGGYLGVFGYINNAEVQNLYVNDIVITGHDHVGCIVGECDGSTAITGCRVTTATLNVAGDATYQQLFGGIAGRKSGSTMSNNFVLGIDIPQVYHFGAIAGENGGSSQSLISNYYYNCTVGGTAPSQGIGCNAIDVEGAKPVFTLTLADDISASPTPAVVYNTKDYYENGVTIHLSYVTQPDPGYEHIYSVYGSSIDGDSFNMVADAIVTVAPNILINWETAYAGTEADPYLISNVEQWDYLVSNVSISGITYSSKFFKLTEDISVTTKVGNFSTSSTIYHPFSGTFDGNGHTLTYTYNVEPAYQDYISPFSYINGATIKNLHVTGLIKNQGGKYIGGIAGRAEGTNHITNCRSSVDLQADTPNSGYDVSTGGLLGEIRNGIVYFENCLFDGKIRGYNNASSPAVKWGGFVGWVASEYSNEHAYFTNCVFAPTQINLASTSESYTFARRSENNDLSFTNCYYLSTLGTTQGLKARSISGGENVNVSIAGDAQEYSTSNITTYTNGNANLIGLKYGNTLYAGKNESVSINLEFTGELPAHHAPVYTATNATLSGTENPYTLNMGSSTDAAVVISCNNTILVWEGHGTETDPYLIYTNEQWDLLATNVDNGTTYSGTFFKLMDDISVTTMVGASTTGSSYKSFNGTFDGNGHTLNVTYSTGSSDWRAPFSCISGATIKNLHVTGSISTTGMRPAGIVSFVNGNSTIENCWSEVAISSSREGDIDAGGFVARVNKNKSVTLTGCAFTGSITYSVTGGYEGGGMVGYTQENASATLNNCLFAPSSISIITYNTSENKKKHWMFVGGEVRGTCNNCYYNDVAAATSMIKEGKRAYSITGGSDVSVENAGNPTPYNVSGITSYGTGIKHNNVLYAGNGDNVSLNLEYSAGSGYTLSGFVASAGTLTGSSSPYTLAMPDENVTITANVTVDEWVGTGVDWEHAYQIWNSGQLDLLASRVNGSSSSEYNTKYYKLMADITYDGTEANNFTAIGTTIAGQFEHSFNGHFDGQGFTVSGINSVSQWVAYNGLFGKLESGAEVKNVVLANCNIGDGERAGGIAGWNDGTITNCRVTSSVTVNGTAATSAQHGGIVGANSNGTVSHCIFEGTLTKTFSNPDPENVILAYAYGGIVGINNTSATLSDNFVVGAVIPATMHGYGAVVGLNNGTLNRNYYTACTVNGVDNATGVGYAIVSGKNIIHGDLSENDGAVPGNVRTISGYGDSEKIGWAFIASPLADNTDPNSSAVENIFSASEYDLYRLNPSNTMWENYKQTGDHYHFSLENGRGYLYATQDETTVKFIGATTSAYNLNDTKDVTLDEGFNLVGNPFPRAAYVNKSYYKLNDEGSAIVAEPVSSATYISPCNGVIIQGTANEVVTFSTTAPGSVGAAPNNGNLNIALAQATVTRNDADNKTIDNAIVSFNEGSQLGKFYFGHQDANIYITQGREEYAIAFSEGQGEVPVSFVAKQAGSYTLTVNPENVEMTYFHLIDNLTGADVDLLANPSYTFTASMSDYPSRFRLVFSANTENGASTGSGAFAFIDASGNIIITDGPSTGSGTYTLQVIDMMGHVVHSCTDIARSVSTSGMAPGVYILRLIDGENVKTQKIVVR